MRPLLLLCSSCEYDYLSIYDGADWYSTEIGTWCGSGNIPTILSKTKDLYIEFVTDVTGRDNGFKMKYEFFRPSLCKCVSTKCESVYIKETMLHFFVPISCQGILYTLLDCRWIALASMTQMSAWIKVWMSLITREVFIPKELCSFYYCPWHLLLWRGLPPQLSGYLEVPCLKQTWLYSCGIFLKTSHQSLCHSLCCWI